MNNSSDERPAEIIIIKRSKGHGDVHHGGAWKIAFADFMTAMMALFLVLWLINAANEDSKKAVASYFNPVKLVDRTRTTRGLEDAKTGGKASENLSEEDSQGAIEPEKHKGDNLNDEEGDHSFFVNPNKALDDIAAQEHAKIARVALAVEGKELSPGEGDDEPGEVTDFSDPFGPIQKAVPQPEIVKPQEETKPPLDDEGEPKELAHDNSKEHEQEKMGVGQSEHEGEAKVEEKPDVLAHNDMTPAMEEKAIKGQEAQDKLELKAKAIARDIEHQLATQFKGNSPIREALEVKKVKDGVLISLSDQRNAPMFGVGSAVPLGPVVLAMEQIGDILSKEKGEVRIYGFTDARPYKKEGDDNWRLSSARARAVYYMLLRGGLNENRVAQITGFADRKLKVPDDPYAAANRRIEILLEVK